jgi:O-antigen/teichoic acid export membrane protein
VTSLDPGGEAESAQVLAADSSSEAITKQIRGSNLLLVGRVFSLALGLATQIVIVRYLSKSAFGAFAYALSVTALGQIIATFGLDKAIARFVPIYHEREDRARVLGTILTVSVTSVALGAIVIVGVAILDLALSGSIFHAANVGSLVLILIALAPLQALDTMIVGLFAVFARPRAIFFRVYVLAPGLRLAVVAAAAVSGAGVMAMAVGYVAAAAAGTAVYGFVLFRVLRLEGVLGALRLRDARAPIRQILTFTIPLLTTDLVAVLISAVDTLLLGIFRKSADVASFVVVRPAAELNELVLLSFGLLFVPLAARLFARNDDGAIDELYWRTAAWVAVLSFPIFAVTFLLARPLLVFLYGARYGGSALFLTILAPGFYAQAALGFNGSMLMVFGRIRQLVVVNGLTVAINLALSLSLIPRYGALGAAIATSATYAIFNLLKQAALARATSVRFFRKEYLSVYGSVTAAAAGLLVVHLVIRSLALEIGAAVLASLIVFGASVRALRVAQAFPEFRAVPFVRLFLDK